jgi:hypothetical protein
MDYRIKNTDTEIGTGRRVGCKSKEQWKKIIICLTKYKGKWVKMVRKHDNEAQINVDDQ